MHQSVESQACQIMTAAQHSVTDKQTFGSSPDMFCLSLAGPIFAGSATSSPLKQQSQISSNDLGMELQKARHDPKVKAVVLRVDSPGSASAGLSITCCWSNTCITLSLCSSM